MRAGQHTGPMGSPAAGGTRGCEAAKLVADGASGCSGKDEKVVKAWWLGSVR